jgi:hypothetical protein
MTKAEFMTTADGRDWVNLDHHVTQTDDMRAALVRLLAAHDALHDIVQNKILYSEDIKGWNEICDAYDHAQEVARVDRPAVQPSSVQPAAALPDHAWAYDRHCLCRRCVDHAAASVHTAVQTTEGQGK